MEEKSRYLTSFFNHLAYGVDYQIWQIHIANEGYDNLIFGACIDEKAKYKLRKKKIKKMQKELASCPPKIASYCGNIQNQTLLPLLKWQYEKTLTPAQLEDEEYEEYGYTEYRRDICLSFLKNELNEIVIQFSETFNSIDDVLKESHHIYERFCEFLKSHFAEKLLLDDYLKYAAIADKLPVYKSLLQQDKESITDGIPDKNKGSENSVKPQIKEIKSFKYISLEKHTEDLSYFKEALVEGGLIKNMDKKDFIKVFSGVFTDVKIIWKGDDVELCYLITQLANVLKLIERIKNRAHWKVVEHYFINNRGNKFVIKNLKTLGKPADSKKVDNALRTLKKYST